MKKNILFLFLAFLQIGMFAQTKWAIDNAHSSVSFTVTHMVISEITGSFKKYSADITASKPDFTDAVIDFTIEVNSINTDNENRDKHLKSPDFFDAEKFPTMNFKSTSLKKISGNKYTLGGNLTIKGVTKPVTFEVTYGGTAKDGQGNTKAGFKANATIDRFDYGLKWNALTEAGGAMVGKDVAIDIKLELKQL
jgi:polyisoprenoid-binding protein YceI